MAYGPPNPARLPMELIIAIPPAAAGPDRNAVGNVQKTGRFAKIPKPAMESEIIFSVGSSSAVDRPIPADASASGNARWNLRSSRRSDRRPHHTMPISPTAYGSAEMNPAWMFETPNALTICGRKKLRP